MKISPTMNINYKNNNRFGFKSKKTSGFKNTVHKDICNLQTNNSINLVFSDFDGTMKISGTRHLTELTKQAIQKLHRENIPLIIATGRMPTEFVKYSADIPIEPDYMIMGHGSHIRSKDKIILDNTISTKDIFAFLDFYSRSKYNDVSLHLKSKDEILKIKYDEIHNNPNRLQEIKRIISTKSYNLLMFYKSDAETFQELETLKNELTEIFRGANLDIFLSSPHCCEIINNNSSKSKASDIIAHITNIPLKNSAAIGDGENDIGIIEHVIQNGGIGVAMGNATKKLMNIAQYIAPKSENDGFAKFILSVIQNNRLLKKAKL